MPPEGHRSTPHYPGMTRTPPPAKEREFVVYQKGKGGTTVHAETCQVTEPGTLIFRTNGELVMAFSPSGWTFMEEAEADD